MAYVEGTVEGLPVLTWGDGPPLLALPGLSGDHRNPAPAERRMQTANLRQVARRFTVHLVQRRPGLPLGASMADIADDVARAARARFGGPVPVFGTSTGGSVALQLALDHPDVVSRLVLGCAAHRLGEEGRRRQRRLAELTQAGRPRRAWAQLGPVLTGNPATAVLMSGLMWIGAGREPARVGDVLATVAAEDAFDVGHRLGEVRAPTLVVGGGRDGFYGAELFRATARGIPDGHLLLLPRSSHMTALAHRSVQRAIAAFLADEEWR